MDRTNKSGDDEEDRVGSAAARNFFTASVAGHDNNGEYAP
jgi:hypothetical protein